MSTGNLILTLLLVIPLGQEAAKIRVRITMFEIPFMIVSRTIATRVAEDGSIIGTMVGGSTTGSFPDGEVTIHNRLPAASDSVDIVKAIREFMAYGCITAQDIGVNEFTRHELIFDLQDGAGEEVYQELHKGRPSPLSYRLAIEPVWENEREAGLALQVRLRWQDPFGIQDIRDNIPERLVYDQTVFVRFGQTTLVGFPSSSSRSRRSIYWLAIAVDLGLTRQRTEFMLSAHG
jgi:hypothetical protein